MTDEPALGPLAGIRVLEIANVIAGPTAGQVLGDYGADVIKIEHPKGGDGSRRQGKMKDGKSLWFKTLGRNKRSICLTLSDPEAAEVFLKLVETADVVVENFRPGTLERWNLGYDRLRAANPKIILARLTGFGQWGPYSHKPAFGTNIEAMTGFADLTGEAGRPPMLAIFALADYVAGYVLTAAITMALYHRDARGGTGQVIDASLFRPLMSALARQIAHYDQLGFLETRSGNKSTAAAPRNAYLTRDGKWVALSTATEELAARTMVLVGMPEVTTEPWFSTAGGRVAHMDLLDGGVAKWVGERTRDEVLALADEHEVTFAPVNTIADMMADPHVRETGIITEVQDPELGSVRMPGVLFGMSQTPGAIRWTGPALASSSDEVFLNEIGLDPDVLSRLRARGVAR